MLLLLFVIIDSAIGDGIPFKHKENVLLQSIQPTETEVENAIFILKSAGICSDGFCNFQFEGERGDNKPFRFLSETDEDSSEDDWFYVKNSLLALACVSVAAMAAGLTMGLVSMEAIDLRIKELASDSPEERRHAKILMPLVRDHHRLLVTLLLLNAMANEALPLFLDKIVPGYVAVIMSVTLVLFFGEIIPSAIFSGPNKLAISSKFAPLVHCFLVLLCPLAWPIAKVLDNVLHNDDHDDTQKYDRRELSALVRIQFEDRMATKMRTKFERANVGASDRNRGARNSNELMTARSASSRFVRDLDTVNMVEGALNMQTKIVADIMTPLRDVYAIPNDLVLDESNILEIYRRGHSRVPVFDCDENSLDDDKLSISGVFKTKQLMVVNSGESRNISSFETMKPHCVSPTMNMIELLNLLQSGVQMAIVALHPDVGKEALDNNKAIPKSAGVTGIVTLEDCIEELIQEEIYDEFDQLEQRNNRRAQWVVEKWKRFVKKKKEARLEATQSDHDENDSLLSYGDESSSESRNYYSVLHDNSVHRDTTPLIV